MQGPKGGDALTRRGLLAAGIAAGLGAIASLARPRLGQAHEVLLTGSVKVRKGQRIVNAQFDFGKGNYLFAFP